jgi:hypothetical protein
MQDDRPDPDLDDTTDETESDTHDDAVLAADDTGMLAGERLITVTEIEEGLEGK